MANPEQQQNLERAEAIAKNTDKQQLDVAQQITNELAEAEGNRRAIVGDAERMAFTVGFNPLESEGYGNFADNEKIVADVDGVRAEFAEYQSDVEALQAMMSTYKVEGSITADQREFLNAKLADDTEYDRYVGKTLEGTAVLDDIIQTAGVEESNPTGDFDGDFSEYRLQGNEKVDYEFSNLNLTGEQLNSAADFVAALSESDVPKIKELLPVKGGELTQVGQINLAAAVNRVFAELSDYQIPASDIMAGLPKILEYAKEMRFSLDDAGNLTVEMPGFRKFWQVNQVALAAAPQAEADQAETAENGAENQPEQSEVSQETPAYVANTATILRQLISTGNSMYGNVSENAQKWLEENLTGSDEEIYAQYTDLIGALADRPAYFTLGNYQKLVAAVEAKLEEGKPDEEILARMEQGIDYKSGQ